MINSIKYCILYDGIPIEGISNGNPIFVVHDKQTPSFTFSSYEQAKYSITNMVITAIHHNNNNNNYDLNKLSVGTIETKVQKFTHTNVYDDVLLYVLSSEYNNEARDILVAKILQLCVRCGFRKILPLRHRQLLDTIEFKEVFDKNVPFFVQQNIERFMDVGINTCTPDEIGAIILTSTDELLEAIQIDSLNNVSK